MTLALAYAQEYPERVGAMLLRGVCLLRPRELRWFFSEVSGRHVEAGLLRLRRVKPCTGTLQEYPHRAGAMLLRGVCLLRPRELQWLFSEVSGRTFKTRVVCLRCVGTCLNQVGPNQWGPRCCRVSLLRVGQLWWFSEVDGGSGRRPLEEERSVGYLAAAANAEVTLLG